MKRKLLKLSKVTFLSLIIIWSGTGLISAQTVSGTMQGRVTDANNAVIPGATVTIKNDETGQTRTVTTNDEGLFNAPFLPIGSYTVDATRNDFNKVVRQNIQVALNDTAVVNFTLDPSVKGEVTVTAEAPIINTTNAQIAGNLTSEQITERPVLNQANFLSLAETFTGYQENPTSGQNNPTASSGSSINFNGTGTRGATFQINGVNNDDSSENQNRQGASLATIKEFQVITNNFTAEFGRGYGAVVLVQTKNGTNSYKGEVYIYHNDSALNANSFFNNFNNVRKPVDRRNQFGGVFGFPVLKNRLFGFVSLDHIEDTGGGSATKDIFTPSEKVESTWFQQTPGNATDANKAFIRSVLARFGNLVPNAPATSARTWAGVANRDFPARDYSGRLDLNATTADTITARWQYTRQIFKADDVIIGERADQNHHQNSGGLTWTHLFSSQIVGEFRYGLGLRTTLVNIAAGNNTPIIRFGGTFGSIIGNAGGFPIQRYQTDNQFVYNVSAVLGSKHFLKAGTDIRRQRLDDLADNFSRGFYTFAATCNGINYGTSYNAFLNGCVTTYQKGYGPFFIENRIGESNFYVEDTWKLFSNLNLILGGRYEYVSAPTEAQDRIIYGIKADSNNWEPRFGFTYSPSNEDNWITKKLFGKPGDAVFRGGYGIFHGRLFQSVFSQSGATVRFNPPNAFFYNQTGVDTSLFKPNNLTDPTNGFNFVAGPQTTRHAEALVDPGLEMPYTQQWNLTFERQLPWKSAVRISYTGNRGIGLLRFALDNLPLNTPSGVLVANHPNNAPGVLYNLTTFTADDPRRVDVRGMTLKLATNAQCAGTGLVGVAVTADCPVAVPLGNLEYSFRVPRTNERRPNGNFTTNTSISNGAWSYYHGLQIEVTKRLSDNMNFQAAYTFSKAIDTTSEATAVGTGDTNQSGNATRIARGLSRFHTPHRFTFFGTYRFPFFKKQTNLVERVLGGWQGSMVFKWVHGTPFTVINGGGADLNLDGFAETRPVLINPNIYGNTVGNREGDTNQLPRSAFRAPTIADFGCCVLGRNTFYMDGVKNFDFGLTRIFPMPFEGHKLVLRADLFNAFNHVQFGFPNPDFTSATFGRITSGAFTYTPRRIQLSFRYSF